MLTNPDVNEPCIVHYIHNLTSSFGSVSLIQPILTRTSFTECYLVCQDFNVFSEPAAPFFSSYRTLPISFVDAHTAFLRGFNANLNNSLDRYRMAYEKRLTNSIPICSNAPPTVLKKIVSLFKSLDSDKFGAVSTRAKFGGVTVQPLFHKLYRFLSFSSSHPKPLVPYSVYSDHMSSSEKFFDTSSSPISRQLSDEIELDSFSHVNDDKEKLISETTTVTFHTPIVTDVVSNDSCFKKLSKFSKN